jgi:hypothetical protein
MWRVDFQKRTNPSYFKNKNLLNVKKKCKNCNAIIPSAVTTGKGAIRSTNKYCRKCQSRLWERKKRYQKRHCIFCGAILKSKHLNGLSIVNRRKFCGLKCKQSSHGHKILSTTSCIGCGKIVKQKQIHQKYCIECKNKIRKEYKSLWAQFGKQIEYEPATKKTMAIKRSLKKNILDDQLLNKISQGATHEAYL